MNARVSPTCKWDTVTAFSGLEFVQYEWRGVPKGCETEARTHPYLEIEPEPQTVEAPAKPKPARKRTPRKRPTAKAKDNK